MKEEDVTGLVINPAITETVLMTPAGAAAVPVCIHCLDVPQAPMPAEPQKPGLVNPYTGGPLTP